MYRRDARRRLGPTETPELPESAKGFDHHLDPLGELGDGRGVPVDQVQVHPGQERMVLAEPTGQRLGQHRDL